MRGILHNMGPFSPVLHIVHIRTEPLIPQWPPGAASQPLWVTSSAVTQVPPRCSTINVLRTGKAPAPLLSLCWHMGFCSSSSRSSNQLVPCSTVSWSAPYSWSNPARPHHMQGVALCFLTRDYFFLFAVVEEDRGEVSLIKSFPSCYFSLGTECPCCH